jgi:hypothetical protein
VRLNVYGDGAFLIESAIDFVVDGAENARDSGALSVGLLLFSPSKQ